MVLLSKIITLAMAFIALVIAIGVVYYFLPLSSTPTPAPALKTPIPVPSIPVTKPLPVTIPTPAPVTPPKAGSQEAALSIDIAYYDRSKNETVITIRNGGSADVNLGAAYIVSTDGEVIYSEQTTLKIFGRQAKSITIEGELLPGTYSVKVVASDGSASVYTFKVE